MLLSRRILLLVLGVVFLAANYSDRYGVRAQSDDDLYVENEDDYDKEYEIFDVAAPSLPAHNLPNPQQTNGDTNLDPDNRKLKHVHCLHQERTRVCDCGYSNEDFTIPILSGSINQIVIRNCKRIVIRGGTFSALQRLHRLDLENLEDAIIEPHAMSFTSTDWTNTWVRIALTNVNVQHIPAHSFNGFIQSLSMVNCKLGTLEQFAVTGLRNAMDTLLIQDTTIARIEPQTFKKFSVETIDLNNLRFTQEVPSRIFFDVDVQNRFTIRNCHFATVQASAFSMNDVSAFTLTDNRFDRLSAEAFRMAIMREVIIRNNTLGRSDAAAFRSLTLNSNFWRQNNEAARINLVANTIMIDSPAMMALEVPHDFNLHLNKLHYLNHLTCDQIGTLRGQAFFEDNSEQIFFRMEDKLLETTDDSDNSFHTFGYISNQVCVQRSLFWYYILIGGTILFVMVLSVIIGLCVWYRRRKARRTKLVMPEGKTYRETQIVMQIENHGLLKTDL